MRTIPEEVIASWPEPNYIDPVTRGPALIIVECIGLAIALVCLILRLYVRAFLMRNIGLDDWIMVAAMVCILINMINGLHPVWTVIS